MKLKEFYELLRPLAKPSNYLPTHHVEGIVQFVKLLEKGHFRAVIFDLDQTLIPRRQTCMTLTVVDLLRSLQLRYKCCILTNCDKRSDKGERIEVIRRQAGLKIFCCRPRKPHPKAFSKVLAYLQCTPSEVVMVGDRILTDVVGGRNLGITTILVEPLNWKEDPFLQVTVPRLLERLAARMFRLLIPLG